MKRLIISASLVSILLGAAETAVAAGWVIDFEDLTRPGDDAVTHGRIIDNEYAGQIVGAPDGLGVTVGVRNFKAERMGGHQAAIAFDTNVRQKQDKDLRGPFLHSSATSRDDERHDPGNILVIQNRKVGKCDGAFCSKPNDEGSREGGAFSFVFTAPVSLTSLDVFDIEETRDGETGAIRFFSDVAGTSQIGPVIATPFTGDHRWSQVTFNVTGVRKMVVEMNGSGGIDRLAGAASEQPGTTPNAQNVPETGSLLLLLTGLLGLGIARRRIMNAGRRLG